MDNLKNISLDGQPLSNHFNKKKTKEINKERNQTIYELKSITRRGIKEKIVVKDKSDKNGRVIIYSRQQINRENKEKDMEEILSKDVSNREKILAILMSGETYNVKDIYEILIDNNVDTDLNRVSAAINQLYKKTQIGVLIYRKPSRPYVYTLHIEATKIDYRLLKRLMIKTDPITIKDVIKTHPNVAEAVKEYKDKRIADMGEEENDVVQTNTFDFTSILKDKEGSQRSKVLAILMGGGSYTSMKMHNTLLKHKVNISASAVASIFISIKKSKLGVFVNKEVSGRTVTFSIIPEALKIGFKDANRLMLKTENFSLKSLFKIYPDLEDLMIKHPKKAAKIEPDKDLETTDEKIDKDKEIEVKKVETIPSVIIPTETKHTVNVNFTFRIIFGKD